MKKNKRFWQNEKGFSLMEILIVITLIALAGTFVANQLLDRLAEGNINGAKIQMNSFKQLLEDYRRYCNVYPSTEQGLDALVNKPTNPPECKNYPASGFISGGKLPSDPWGTPYTYESDGAKYTITSLGSDLKEGGTGNAADIKSTDI